MVHHIESLWLFVAGAVVLSVSVAALVYGWLSNRPSSPAVPTPPSDATAKPALAGALRTTSDPIATPTAPPAVASSAVSAATATDATARVLVVFASEIHAAELSAALPLPCVQVKSAIELASAMKRKSSVAAFVDVAMLSQIRGFPLIPIIGIVDGKPSEMLPTVVRSLHSFSWLSHLIAAATLATDHGRAHVRTLVERLIQGPEHELLGNDRTGRVARLARASHRQQRIERMVDLFAKQDLPPRALTTIEEVAEELVMNALYNAPGEAGYFKTPVSRTEDVTLPPDRACEISYGVDNGAAFVRVRDSFGALKRGRLLEVLNRCNGDGVTLDESRGGAGLGIWRVFSAATTIAITVIPGRLTDIVIGIAPRQPRAARQLLSVHLFFVPETHSALEQMVLDNSSGVVDQSITLLHAVN